jgi:hypothetical protein
VSWSECYWSWIEWELQKTWMPLKAVVGGIYSLQPLPSRWLFLLSMGTLDSPVVHRTEHCSLSGACHVSTPLGFGAVDRWSPLSCSFTGQSGATPDMSGAFWLHSLTSEFALYTFAVDRWAQVTVAPLDHRTCPVHTGHVRWIIAERALVKPESAQFEWSSAWGTGHCPVRHLQHTLKSLVQILFEPPT